MIPLIFSFVLIAKTTSWAQPKASLNARPVESKNSRRIPQVNARPDPLADARLSFPVQLRPIDLKQEGLELIQWNPKRSEVKGIRKQKQIDYEMRIEGAFQVTDPKGYSVLMNDQKIDLGTDRTFVFTVPYGFESDDDEMVRVSVIDPNGFQYHLIYFLDITDKSQLNREYRRYSKEDPYRGLRRFSHSIGTGISLLSYSQTNSVAAESVSAPVLTLKGTVNYAMVPGKYDLGFTGYFNYLSLGSGLASEVRTLGLNLRAGWVLPRVKNPWRVTLFGGLYYATMMSTEKRFGFQNLMGPQIYPSFRKTLAGGKVITGYLKYSPILNGAQLLPLSNREFALGATYFFAVKKQTLGVGLDFSHLGLSVYEREISLSTLSITGSILF